MIASSTETKLFASSLLRCSILLQFSRLLFSVSLCFFRTVV